MNMRRCGGIMKRSCGRLDTDEPLGKIDLARRDLLVGALDLILERAGNDVIIARH